MLIPLSHIVLVKPERVEEVDDRIRSARAAGIHVELDKREQKAVEVGTIVAVKPTSL